MCLNEIDLSLFLTEESPVPHDIDFLVEDQFKNDDTRTMKAHRYDCSKNNILVSFRHIFGVVAPYLTISGVFASF